MEQAEPVKTEIVIEHYPIGTTLWQIVQDWKDGQLEECRADAFEVNGVVVYIHAIDDYTNEHTVLYGCPGLYDPLGLDEIYTTEKDAQRAADGMNKGES